MQLTLCSANYVARAAHYALQPFNWGEAERITVEQMSLAEFDAICRDVVAAGFRTIEVWRGHAWYATLDESRAAVMRQNMGRHGIAPIRYAGVVGGAGGGATDAHG